MPFPSDDLFPSDELFPGSASPGPRRIPRLCFPLNLIGSGFQVVEQDSVDDVAQCVYAVMATPRGSRIEAPDFGITDPTFVQGGMDLGEALLQIRTWEPRASVALEQDIVGLTDTIRAEVGVG